MNQRVEVRSLIKKDGKILLLKRVGEQGTVGEKFELLGSRIEHEEQPEEAVSRSIKEAIGLGVQTAFLSDVFTYIDHNKRATQRIVVLYIVSISNDGGGIELSQKYNTYEWMKVTDIHQEDVTELSHILLVSQKEKAGVTTDIDGVKIQDDVIYSTDKKSGVVIYSDGGSRGNPGPSAAGYVIKDMNGRLEYEGGAYIGITTNNQAEYHGVRLGLEKARELGAKSAECYVDSMLVVNQLNGQYVIRNRELWPIHERIKELIGQFEKVSFRHVKREFNQQADGMVNRILDARTSKEDLKV